MIRVQKNNVQYRIDESRLAAYKKRGFTAVGVVDEQGKEKPLSRMNKEELLAKAAELGLEAPEGASNNDIKELIEAALGE